MEIWRDVPGYEGEYQVSNFGNVKSLITNKLLKTHTGKNGYVYVTFGIRSKRHTFKLHRLVASVFIRQPKKDEEVNHKDMNKTNNHVDNLEWCYRSGNIRHSFAMGGRERNKKMLLLANSKKVVQFDKEGNAIKTWDSMSQAARDLNLHVENICHCCKGKIKETGGFLWLYLSDYQKQMKSS